MAKENQFLTSVANVRLFDNTTGDLILNGKALLNSSMTQAIQNQAIYAGKGSKKVYELDYQKELTFAIEDATFSTTYIALQNGTKINRELAEYFTDEVVRLDASGKAKLNKVPVGKVHVEQINGTFSQVVAGGTDGDEIEFLPMANKEVTVVYPVSEMMDTITISGEEFPASVRMELNADIRTNRGKFGEMIIDAPAFKPNGALELAMTHDGVASSSLEGSCLADNKGNYAYIKIHEIDQAQVQYTALASNPSKVQLDAVNTPSVTVSVLGIRGGNYNNVLLVNTDLTWTSEDQAVATVDANGVITIAAGASTGDHTVINVTDGSYNEVIAVYIS
ncbi:hypothetical protein LC76P1_00157 [Lysinibacillus phage LC76P1]|nr:hypothetical protein LC76P1_00157 [Lysinibacillus phage LC76P1]